MKRVTPELYERICVLREAKVPKTVIARMLDVGVKQIDLALQRGGAFDPQWLRALGRAQIKRLNADPAYCAARRARWAQVNARRNADGGAVRRAMASRAETHRSTLGLTPEQYADYLDPKLARLCTAAERLALATTGRIA